MNHFIEQRRQRDRFLGRQARDRSAKRNENRDDSDHRSIFSFPAIRIWVIIKLSRANGRRVPRAGPVAKTGAEEIHENPVRLYSRLLMNVTGNGLPPG
jgi:hypothetical protein